MSYLLANRAGSYGAVSRGAAVVSKKTRLVTAGMLAATTVVGVGVRPALASSHREAPAISQDPTADNTDVYAFRDTTDPTKVNIVANYIGLEDPNGGPNFARFGDDVNYVVHVDNNGDVADDITYNFRFRTITTNPNTFLYNTGQLTSPTDPDLSVRQTYSVEKVTPSGRQMLATDALVPPVNVGVRSVPGDYEAQIAQPTITNLTGGGKVFAGSRKDPFFADVGSIFDLGGLRPLNGAHAIPVPPARDGSGNVGIDVLNGKNVHTIAMQLPISSVTAGGATPTVVDSKASVIGVHASSERQRVRVLSVDGSSPPRNAGRWVQVSRLAIPLVNEVLIPMGKKDRFNGTAPKDDGAEGFFNNILDPEFTRLLPTLYPTVFSTNNVPAGGAANRPDLVQLVTGQLAGLSPTNALPPADLLRINLASTAGTAHFPNGRQLADDVVDTEIQVLAGVFTDPDHDGKINKLDGSSNPTGVPYSALGDGVNAPSTPLLNVFPYVGTPLDGYNAYNCDLIKTCPAGVPGPPG